MLCRDEAIDLENFKLNAAAQEKYSRPYSLPLQNAYVLRQGTEK